MVSRRVRESGVFGLFGWEGFILWSEVAAGVWKKGWVCDDDVNWNSSR